MKVSVYGKTIIVEGEENKWKVYYPSPDGKRRNAEDIFIPSHIKEEELLGYIADLLHEWATPDNSEVKVIG
ncbi:MAG: hypothetical protein KDK36_04275 [Leptospiraceae bacterium]|nr:hypothetical protein [Leptospiraceae bacterium]